MNRLTRTHRILLCAGVAALLFLAGLGRPALWEPDEGRYAEIAREMVVSGDYITPRDDWVRYFEKPPLMYWSTAASLKIFGRNEFAVRLPEALFSVGQVAITEALGEVIFGAAIGMLGAMVLALSPLFFAFARFATPDPSLSFCFTAAMAAFYMAARAGSFKRGAGRRWMIASAVMLALGTLAKGPVALALGGGIALAWLIVEGRVREALEIPWFWCVAVYLAISAPWFVIAAERNPDFLKFFFMYENVTRYLDFTEHAWGPYFFVMVVAGGMWPWVYFIPIGLSELRKAPSDESAAVKRGAFWFLLIWFGLIFIFFSIPAAKLGSYILPGIPPLAILAAVGLWRVIHVAAERARRILGIFVVINVIIAVAAYIASVIIDRRLGAALAIDAAAVATAFLLGATGAYIAARLQRTRLVPAIIAIGVLLAIGGLVKGREDASTLNTYRNLARETVPYLKKGCFFASYRHFVQSLPFYTQHREILVDYRGELAPFSHGQEASASFIAPDFRLQQLWTNNPCVVVVANRQDLPHLRLLLNSPKPVIVACEGKKFSLYNGKPLKTAREVACGDSSQDFKAGHSKLLGFVKGDR